MALRVMFVLAVLLTSFLEIQVLAQNNTTIAISPTPTMSLVASSTAGGPNANSTSAPGSTPAGTPSPTTSIQFEPKVMFMVIIEGECKQNTSADIKKWIEDTVYDSGYNAKTVDVEAKPIDNSCKVNITVQFGVTKPDIILKLENASGLPNGIKIERIEKINVNGADLGEYQGEEDECKSKCCDGGPGGEIKATRKCEPSGKCGNLNLTKMKAKCLDFCKCSAGISLQVSLAILIFSGFLNWFLKE